MTTDTNEQAALFEALAQFQAKAKNPEKTRKASIKSSKGSYSYMYADIADVLRGALPVLSEFGLALIQTTAIENDWIVLDTMVTHKAGGAVRGRFPVCPVSATDKERGSSMTYSRRYAACAMLGLAAEEDVDTGEGDRTHSTPKAAAPVQTIDTERAALLDNNIAAVKGDLDAILRHFGVDSLKDLTPDQADKVEAQIKKRAEAQTEEAA